MSTKELIRIRQAVADYMSSEGCDCCRNGPEHKENKARLAKLLRVPKYQDGSGFNFRSFETKDESRTCLPRVKGKKK